MGIFKTKTWSAVDIMLLKWSSAFFGMIVGAYVSNFGLAVLGEFSS